MNHKLRRTVGGALLVGALVVLIPGRATFAELFIGVALLLVGGRMFRTEDSDPVVSTERSADHDDNSYTGLGKLEIQAICGLAVFCLNIAFILAGNEHRFGYLLSNPASSLAVVLGLGIVSAILVWPWSCEFFRNGKR